MSTFNNNTDAIASIPDKAEYIEEEHEQVESDKQFEKTSSDTTLPVESIERTRRSTLELTQWRSAMARPEHTTTVARRWYFRSADNKENIYDNVGQSMPEGPSVAVAGDLWTSAMKMDGINIGWYWIVVCVSLKNLDRSKASNLTVDVYRREANQEDWLWTDNSCETVVRSEELENIPGEDFVRIRLHRQLMIEDIEEDIQLRIFVGNNDDNDNAGSLDVHYFELGTNTFDSPSGVKDHIIYGDGIPDYFITVGANELSRTQAIEIQTYMISDTKNYAVTVHYTPGECHINVWDLRCPDDYIPGNKKSRPITTPIGYTSFHVSPQLTDPQLLKEYSTVASISSSGMQVVVGSEREMPNAIPFQVFRMSTGSSIEKAAPVTANLIRVPSISQHLASYFGIGVFHRMDTTSTDDKDERYIVYNGLTLEVYDTQNWSRIYSLDLGYQRSDEYTICIGQSLRGKYFCWNGANGVISIWDMETGRIASNIFVQEDRSTTYAILSPDETKVAILVKGTIQIYDTVTGIKMGTYFEGLDSNNDFAVVFEQDHFLTFNRRLSDSRDITFPNRRSVVRVRDLSVTEDYYLHEDYSVQYPHIGHVPFFTSCGGSVVNFLSLGDILYPASEEFSCGVSSDCPMLDRALDIFYIDSVRVYTNSDGVSFVAYSDQVYVNGESLHILKLSVGDDFEEMTNVFVITLGVMLENRIFWVAEMSQLFIVSEGYLYSWILSDSTDKVATLNRVIKFVDDDPEHANDTYITNIFNVKMCEHACQYKFELKPTFWYSTSAGLVRAPVGAPNNILTFPKTAIDTFSTTQEYRDEMGILGLIPRYRYGNPEFKEDIIQYLKKRIRTSPENPTSCLVTICRAWTSDDKAALEDILAELLPSKYITWIPDPHEDKSTEPLAILLNIALSQPKVFGAAKVVMNYCVTHANRSKNLAFLSPLFGSMHEVMELYPDEALECMGRIAFIPVKNRAYIIDNHLLALPPRPRFRFWEPRTKPLTMTKDPLMQFHYTAEKADSSNDGFTRPVFMASFDALWYYKDQQQTEIKKDGFQAASNTASTTWWETIYHMIRLKTRLRMPTIVESYDFNIEFFDNPAIAALVNYKWNTIGYSYWLFRFVFQCVFYALVVAAGLMQVYGQKNHNVMTGLFIAIIAMGSVFLWLELLQAIHSWTRYARSVTNFMDMVAFAVPLIGSAIQLKSISDNNMDGHTRIMSYAILAVFTHMIFELRIHQGVCKYVMIIQQTVIEISVFFIIFAVGLIAFTIATQHLLRACPVEGCKRDDTDFPEHPFFALSATYFFMGGRYDPVSPLFDSKDGAFHIMMIIYFFFTVIVMLNVLIALINVAFTKGDDGWRLAWIESRLRYIESAENMSYNIPGFRQTHNWFPKQIYFSATSQQVRDYQEKYHKGNDAVMELFDTTGEEIEDDVDPIFNNVPREDEEEQEEQGDQTEGEQQEEGDNGETAQDDTNGGETAEGNHGNEDEAAVEPGNEEDEGEWEDMEDEEEDKTEKRSEEQPSSSEKPKETQSTKQINRQNTKKDKNADINSQDLRIQVSEMKKQLAAQQEQAQKQFDELKELLLRAMLAKQ
ncbi:hypothetical protein FBU30_008070 [Linnemannia zychae]|nr:hypothetical protein FBU30_008070 [Linnemannia zychae]